MRYVVGLACVMALGVMGCGETSGAGGDCVAGEPTACFTVCGSVGEGTCSDDGAVPATEDCTPPAEQCDNGLDDDCDGLIDPGFGTLVGSSTQLDDEAIGVRVGALGNDAWIAWVHGLRTTPGASVYGAWLAPDGTAAIAPAALAPTTDTQLIGRPGPGDDQVLVPWIQYPDGVTERVAGLLFAPDGSTVALQNSWTEDGATSAAAAWSGADFGLFWAADGPASDQDDLRFARVGADGATLTRPVDVVPAAGEQFKSGVAATWNGTSFGVVWDETACTPFCLHRLRLAEVSRTGMLLSVVDVVDPEGSGLGVWQLEWTGTEYVLAWEREGGSEAYLMLVDALGGILAWHQLSAGRPLDERLGGMHFRQVADGFEVVWSVSRSWGAVLYAQRLSSTLSPEGPEQVVTWSDERWINDPGLTTSGGSLLLSWSERPLDAPPFPGPDLLFVQPMGTCAAP